MTFSKTFRRWMFAEIVSEVQVKKFGKFLDEYASQLRDVEDALEELEGDSWDLMLDPVAVEVRRKATGALRYLFLVGF